MSRGTSHRWWRCHRRPRRCRQRRCCRPRACSRCWSRTWRRSRHRRPRTDQRFVLGHRRVAHGQGAAVVGDSSAGHALALRGVRGDLGGVDHRLPARDGDSTAGNEAGEAAAGDRVAGHDAVGQRELALAVDRAAEAVTASARRAVAVGQGQPGDARVAAAGDLEDPRVRAGRAGRALPEIARSSASGAGDGDGAVDLKLAVCQVDRGVRGPGHGGGEGDHVGLGGVALATVMASRREQTAVQSCRAGVVGDGVHLQVGGVAADGANSTAAPTAPAAMPARRRLRAVRRAWARSRRCASRSNARCDI